MPLLMVEVDRATEPAHRAADKLAAYAALYRRRVTDPAAPGTWRRTGEDGTVPYWSTLYPGTGQPGWPPVAFVFTGAGPRALANRMQTVADLSRDHWAAEYRTDSGTVREDRDGYLDFTHAVPLVLTTLDRLKQHGPMGAAWWRVAQRRSAEFEPLLQALTNTYTKAEFHERQERRDAERRAQQEAEHAAARAELAKEWDITTEAEPAAVRAGLTPGWGTTTEAESGVSQCATPDCGPLDAYVSFPVPPADGVYCGKCRADRADQADAEPYARKRWRRRK